MPVTIGGGLPFCGRELTSSEWDLIREVTRDFSSLGLTELARTICELLEWRRPNGGLKGRECYLFLLTLRSRGWLPWLPPPRPQARHPHTTTVDWQSDSQAPCTNPLPSWLPLQLQLIDTVGDRKLLEQYIHRYHYLGYRVPYGAQLRYFIRSQQLPDRLLACLLFTSAAWKMAPRDQYIGWSDLSRKSNLAHILGRMATRISDDWQQIYGHPIYFLETFVDPERFRGTCYRAANWVFLGKTTGRGKQSNSYVPNRSIKEVLGYPLTKRFRELLTEAG
jgi:hypothetical protein